MTSPSVVAPVSVATFSFLGIASLLGGVYRFGVPGPLADWVFGIAIAFGVLGTIQIANSLASYLPRPIAVVIHWIRALTLEMVAVLSLGLLRPIHYLSKGGAVRGPLTGRPILLIHGYLHDSSAWTYLGRKLAQQNFGPVYSLNLGYPFRSIRDFAEKVKDQAAKIEKETQRSDLILIGHSMGGLVSAWYATRIAPLGKVTDVITVGSPIGGTYVAKMGLGSSAREMERGSNFSKELQEEMKKNGAIRFYHIGAKTDQIVIPSKSAIVEGPVERQFIPEDMGHISLLFSPRVAEVIQTWLTH